LCFAAIFVFNMGDKASSAAPMEPKGEMQAEFALAPRSPWRATCPHVQINARRLTRSLQAPRNPTESHNPFS